MAIVFAAIVPHPALLIPGIGRENSKLLSNTAAACQKLEQDLYVSQPDTIVVLSPHGEIHQNCFSLNQCPDFIAQFPEFGDLSTKLSFTGNVMLTHKIRESLETSAPVKMISQPNLDYGTSIPLYLIASHLPKVKIIPIYLSGLSLEAHYKFGQLLKRELLINTERIAVVASSDLSHRLMKNSPVGYSPKAKKFDKKLIDNITRHSIDDILQIDQELVSEVSICGLRAIVMLLGVLDGTEYKPQLLNYEYPLGVGYLTMKMRL